MLTIPLSSLLFLILKLSRIGFASKIFRLRSNAPLVICSIIINCLATVACTGNAPPPVPYGLAMSTGVAISNSQGSVTSDANNSDLKQNKGDPYQIKSGGISLGVDFQWPFRKTLSLNAIAKLSYENEVPLFKIGNNTFVPGSVQVSHDVLGVQLRNWYGTWFNGVQLGTHYQSTAFRIAGFDKREVRISKRQAGISLLAGFESKTGMIFTASAEFTPTQYDSVSADSTTVRLEGGLRFK